MFSIGLSSFTNFKEIWKTKSNFLSSSDVPSAQLIDRCSISVDLPIPPPAANQAKKILLVNNTSTDVHSEGQYSI